MDHLPLRPLPDFTQIGMISLAELGLRRLTKNREENGAEQENTKRNDTSFFDATEPSLKKTF